MNFIKLLNFYKLINILEQYLFLAEGGSRPLRDFVQEHMISKKVTETTFFLTPVDDPISEKKNGTLRKVSVKTKCDDLQIL